jgi:hypothetical protein
VIWLLAHYPRPAEAGARVAVAADLHRALDLPIRVFGSRSAQFPEPVERQLRARLLAAGVPPEVLGRAH